MHERNPSRRPLTFLLATLIAIQPLVLLSQEGPNLPDPGRTSLSREDQIKLGQQVSAEVYKQMPVLPESSPVTQYVQQLGKKLEAGIPPDRSWPYRFQVVAQKEINAFAIPGGPIFINLGTIQAAENEAELAGVMAHEMSHVYMQHSAKQIAKSQWTGLLAGIAGAVMPQSGLGNLARMGIQFGAGTVMMKYSRGDEAQADSVGAIIMYKAGYDPKAMADFFSTLEKKYGNGGPQFMSDHPNPGNRQAAIQKEIRTWPPRDYLTSSNAFGQAKQKAESIKAYSAQEIAQGAKQGVWAQQNRQNGAIPRSLTVGTSAAGGDIANVSLQQVQPSATFRQARLEGFSISYPDNWQTGGDSNSFLIGPPAGVSENGIAYGVIVSGFAKTEGSLDEAIEQIVRSIQHDNPGTQVAGQISRLKVGGVEGRSLYLSGHSPVRENGKPLPERDWLVVVPRSQGGLTYLLFVSPERDFDQLRPTYRTILDSLQLL